MKRNRSTVKILREIEKHGKVHTFSVYTFRFSMQQRQITAPRGRNTILLTISPINFTEIWNRFEIYGMAEVQLEIWTRYSNQLIHRWKHWNWTANIGLLLFQIKFFSRFDEKYRKRMKISKDGFGQATKYCDPSTINNFNNNGSSRSSNYNSWKTLNFTVEYIES